MNAHPAANVLATEGYGQLSRIGSGKNEGGAPFPLDWPCSWPPDGLRAAIADRIEYLVGLLDAIDGDCDFEEDNPAESDGTDLGDSAWLEYNNGTGDAHHNEGAFPLTGSAEDAEDGGELLQPA